MPYITSIERVAREEGFKEGLQKGLQEGLQQALEEARQDSIWILTKILSHRFGAAVDAYRDHIQNADAATRQLWLEQSLTIENLAALFGKK